MKTITRGNLLTGFFVLLASASFAATTNDTPRERLLLDAGWKFHLGNEWGSGLSLVKGGSSSGPASASFGDASWRTVNLPHDWAIELPFDPKADAAHGFKPVGRGYPTNSVAWYRRSFELPKEDDGKRLWLEFDGVFRDCTVFVNGWFVGHHESGYSSFRYDITDVARYGGTNAVAVRVDASQFEGWFYEGAGIYRHVWLVKTAPLAIAPNGIFVFSQFNNNVPEGRAEIHIQTELANLGNIPANMTVNSEVIRPDGKSLGVTHQSSDLNPSSNRRVGATFYLCPPNSVMRFLHSKNETYVVHPPELWSPESPKLYKLVTTIESGGKIVDRAETEFGIRTVAFDTTNGFLLNGKPYVLKGTCNHQDHAGVGAALPDGLQYFRVARLKEMGCNAYRTAHGPPTPELLEACDRFGMLVMDESRLLGTDAANFERLRNLIERDRNHPSVVIWSLGNEERSQTGATGGRVAAEMQRLVKHLDPTRPVTYAASVGNVFKGINEVIEVRGWNYYIGATNMDAYHAAHPTQPNVGTEQASTVTTRGIYANDKERGYVSAYDVNTPDWGHRAEAWLSFFATRPWLSGGFVWTGFDYRGEPTPYSWPCISSHFGILDTCGFRKDSFYFYQSWWSDKIVLHLLPHWNWPGREGREIDVWAYSNCEEVELFLNGESLGKQTMPRNSHLSWKVKYAPGTLSAKGWYGGQVVAETKVETTGAPASIQLTPDRASINADGEDVSIVTVSVIDAQGRVVPTATNLIRFELTGPGRILGVGNGDPSCHEPDVVFAESPIRRIPVNEWRWKLVPDVRTNIPEYAAQFDDTDWAKADAQSEFGPLETKTNGVFRTRVNLTEQDLAASAVELWFGMIDDNGWIYVNGKKAGDARNWEVPQVFNVKQLLHVGENSVAVGVMNNYGQGGINKGAALELQGTATAPEWKRSVFNGLAQIIVQSSKEPGDIKLTARAEGLSPAILVVPTQPCTPRPAL